MYRGAIRFLGGASCAVYASGGHTGTMLAQLLEAEAIEQYPVPIAGITRESMIVYEERTSLQYRFTMPGPDWREMGHKKLPLIARLLRARPDGEGYGTGPEPTAARN